MLPAKKRLWIEIVLHIAFWAGVFYVLTSLNSSHIHVRLKTRFMFQDRYEDRSISSYVYCTFMFLIVLFYGNIFWVFQKAISYKNSLVRLAICAGWFILVFGANYFVVGPLFDRANTPIEPPESSFRQDFKQLSVIPDKVVPPHPPRIDIVNFMITSWPHLQPVILLAFFAILGISIAYFFLKEWAKSELIQTQLEANQLSAEIKFLKSQINPHFLFNTLNNLYTLVYEKSAKAPEMVIRLSGLLSYVLYECKADEVLLTREISIIRDYVAIEQERYGERLDVSLHFSGELEGKMIVPMLFQPFIENAFKHGASEQLGSSWISVDLSVKKGKLVFKLINSYDAAPAVHSPVGIGITNVEKRLAMLYPEKHELKYGVEGELYVVSLHVDVNNHDPRKNVP